MVAAAEFRQTRVQIICALNWAAVMGYADCVRLLLDAGANKYASDNVRTGPCMILISFATSIVIMFSVSRLLLLA